MKTRYIILLTGVAAALAATTPSLTGQAADAQNPPTSGTLDTLPHGTYQCALPGDAAGKAFRVVPAEEFRIGAASRYSNAQGSGTYILRGNELTFTRGPKKGQRFRRVGTNQVRKLEAGKETKLLCTRLSGVG